MTPKPLSILILQGPNLNLLGQREPEVYGSTTLEDVHAELREAAGPLGVELAFFQSNHEGELIQAVQDAAARGLDGAVINAGSYTHTSIGLRDALKGTALPFVEIHISNVHAREAFRAQSYLSDIAEGVIVGLGTTGYHLALQGLVSKLRRSS